jgi:hypothetical protein
MPSFLDWIRDRLDRTSELVDRTVTLARKVKEHPGIAVGLVSVALAYGSLRWLAIDYPSLTISDFYRAMNAGDPGSAWALLQPNYRRQRWNDDREHFASLFRTTVAYSTVTVKLDGQALNPVSLARQLFADSLTYRVSFSSTDRLSRSDCQRTEQRENCQWLELKDPAAYQQLVTGALRTADAKDEPTVELQRQYAMDVDLQRASQFDWVISRIRTSRVELTK